VLNFAIEHRSRRRADEDRDRLLGAGVFSTVMVHIVSRIH